MKIKGAILLFSLLCALFLLAACGNVTSTNTNSSDKGTFTSDSTNENVQKVNVVFRGNGKGASFEGETNAEVVCGKTLNAIQVPVAYREGFDFLYWAYDTEGELKWSAEDIFTESTVLYAIWDEIVVDKPQPPHVCSYGEWVTVVESTCVRIGKRQRSCSCGKIDYGNIPLADHTEVIIKGREATCIQSGLTDGKECTVCAATLVKQEIIPPAHKEEITIRGKEATCTEPGLTSRKECSVCGTVTAEQREIKARGHSQIIVYGKEPTCYASGLTEGKKCSVCFVTTVEQEIIPPTHKEVTVKGVEPTCKATGLTDGKKCSVCQKILVEQEILPLADHTEAVILGKEPTCKETGLTDGKKCSVCQKILVEQETLPMSAHTEETIVGKAATCKETGLTDGKKCSVCGTVTVKQEIIPVALCNYENYKCTMCGARKESQGLKIYKNSSGDGCYVSGIGECSDTVIVIPRMYEGLPVTQISMSAFEENLTLEEVIIPDTVRIIGDWAFNDCISLKKVVFEGSVEKIEQRAFSKCISLNDINIPTTVIEIGDFAFFECPITSLDLQSVVKIGEDAFYNCDSLGYASLGTKLISIGEGAFGNCDKLNRIVIPKSVIQMGSYAFNHCENLTIYCEVGSAPSTWNSLWNYGLGKCPVVWGYEEN